MKLSFIAAAGVLLAAGAAAAQTPPARTPPVQTPPAGEGVAAATLPNAFGGPPSSVRPAAPATPEAVPAVTADPRAEPLLRTVIASVAAGAPDYEVFTPDAGAKMRALEAEITGLVAGKGDIVAILFQGKQDGADVFRVVFESGADTQWAVGLDAEGKVAFFLFREAAD